MNLMTEQVLSLSHWRIHSDSVEVLVAPNDMLLKLLLREVGNSDLGLTSIQNFLLSIGRANGQGNEVLPLGVAVLDTAEHEVRELGANVLHQKIVLILHQGSSSNLLLLCLSGIGPRKALDFTSQCGDSRVGRECGCGKREHVCLYDYELQESALKKFQFF